VPDCLHGRFEHALLLVLLSHAYLHRVRAAAGIALVEGSSTTPAAGSAICRNWPQTVPAVYVQLGNLLDHTKVGDDVLGKSALMQRAFLCVLPGHMVAS